MTHRGPFQPLLFCDSVKTSTGTAGFGARPGVRRAGPFRRAVRESLRAVSEGGSMQWQTGFTPSTPSSFPAPQLRPSLSTGSSGPRTASRNTFPSTSGKARSARHASVGTGVSTRKKQFSPEGCARFLHLSFFTKSWQSTSDEISERAERKRIQLCTLHRS